MNSQIADKLQNIRTFIFDVDGVLTTGSVLVTEEGDMLRSVNIKDGYALQHAVKQGYNIAIISGGNSQGIFHRFHGLGINQIYLGQKSKTEAFQMVLTDFSVSASEVAYIGDDMPDYPVLKLAGMPCCPADAAEDVLQICQYVAQAKGGLGVAREILEQTMKLHGTWWNDDTHHW